MNYSELESNRFELNVFRGDIIKQIKASKIKQVIEQNQVDILIFRIPAENQYQLYQLHALGYEILVADTLVYYECDLKKRPKTPFRNPDIQFELAKTTDKKILENLTDDIFKDYTNHYFSNPNFEKQAITDGYKEWAMSHLTEKPNYQNNDKLLWIIRQDGDNVGFTACKIEKPNDVFNGILNGIASYARRGGIYEDMIRFVCHYFEERGFSKMRISTQIQNYAVQKVWNRNRFFLTNAYLTIHINSMLRQKNQEN